MARKPKNYPPLSEHRYRVRELPSTIYLRKAEFNWGSYFPFIGPSGIAYAPKMPVPTVGGPPSLFFASREWQDEGDELPADEAETAAMYLNEAMEQGGPYLLLTFASGWKCYCEDTAHKIAQYLGRAGKAAATGGIFNGLTELQWQRLITLERVDLPGVNWNVFVVNDARFVEDSWMIDQAGFDINAEAEQREIPADATDSELVELVHGSIATRQAVWAAGWSRQEHYPNYTVRLEDRGEEFWIVRDVEWKPTVQRAIGKLTKKQAQAIYTNGAWYAQSDIPAPQHPPNAERLLEVLNASGNADDAKTAEKLFHLRFESGTWGDALDIASDGFNDMDYFVSQSGDGEPLYVLTRTPNLTVPVYDSSDTPGENEDLNR